MDIQQQLAQLKLAYENGIWDVATYQAMVSALVNAQIATKSGAVAVGNNNDVLGEGAVKANNVYGDVITGNVYYGGRTDDPAEALNIYRVVLFHGEGQLSLQGMEMRGNTDRRFNLSNIYIPLNTTSTQEIKVKDRYKRSVPIGALEAIAANRKLVITGEPGGGKSTFVNHLAYCLVAHQLYPQEGWLAKQLPEWNKGEGQIIPIKIILRDFAASLPTPLPQKATVEQLWKFVTQRLQAQNLAFVQKPLERALEQGDVLWLLDGLDEVTTVAQRVFVRDLVGVLVQRYPKCRYLVTSRILSYQPPETKNDPDLRLDQQAFPVYELAKFDSGQITAFVERWYLEMARIGAVDGVKRLSLTEALQKAVGMPSLKPLAENPLLLSVMALVHHEDGRLPDARALLYERTVQILLWRWEEVKRDKEGGKARFHELLQKAQRTEADIQRVLREVAYETHLGLAGRTEQDKEADIEESVLHRKLGALCHHETNGLDWNWGAELLQLMKYRAGLLVERKPHVFTFPHRTFQEYLAGAHLATQSSFASQAVARVKEGQALWREVVLFAVGRLIYVLGDSDKPLAFVGELCPQEIEKSEVGWGMAWLAGEALLEMGVVRVRDSQLGCDLLERVKMRLATLVMEGHFHPRERAEAGDTLARLGDPRPGVGVGADGLPDLAWGTEIPAGNYTTGGDKKAWRSFDTKTVLIPTSYQLARYPITNAQFDCFVQAQDVGDMRWWAGMPEGEKKFDNPKWPIANRPRERVSWYQAVAFCRWLSHQRGEAISLPHEYQWEVAARYAGNGQCDKRTYPWGKEPITSERANYDETKLNQTFAVGLFPRGQQPDSGLDDLSGNVFEWCANKYETPDVSDVDQSDDTRALRGGYWRANSGLCRAAYRYDSHPAYRNHNNGFRVVRVLPSQP
jgi:formylglycine-generating enzyme required for sulfatase activity/energy-coupling factor transporter ATP-binding protein EcfA2